MFDPLAERGVWLFASIQMEEAPRILVMWLAVMDFPLAVAGLPHGDAALGAAADIDVALQPGVPAGPAMPSESAP